MDCVGFRNSGELSDITVKVDGEEFNLHKFPLFVRSNYFKSLELSNDGSVSNVALESFPGGPRTFAICADYCYNKNVLVNSDNVIEVRCAAEYLEMNGNSGRGGLGMLADNVLLDVTYSAKSRRDYGLILDLIEKAAKHSKWAEKCGIESKLIEIFVDALAIHVKKALIYEGISLYEKRVSPYSPKKGLHSISLSDENINKLNNLPLKWMNDLVRYAARSALNQSLLSYIIQNYIDYNTNLNPDYNLEIEQIVLAESDEETGDSKKSNLISMAADILNVGNKLNSLVDAESDAEAAEEKDLKPESLISIASAILNIKKTTDSDDDSEETPKNLVQIAGEILKSEEKADKKPDNLISMASDILGEKPKSNLSSILTDILGKEKNSLREDISAIVGVQNTLKKLIKPKTDLSNEDKLNVITVLTKTLTELRTEPHFPISWLLLYTNELHNLNAEPEIKSAFNKWTWNALNNLKNNSKELSSIPPAVMAQLAKDVSSKNDKHDTAKVNFDLKSLSIDRNK